jgi:hypothetical protein
MGKRIWVTLAALAIAVTSASAQATKQPTPAEPPVWRRLERFENDAEFLGYIRDVQRFNERRRRAEYSYESGAIPPPPAPPPPPPAPMATAPSAAPVVSGMVARDASPTPAAEETSITNVQTRGVDEGGIVKMVGRFLITLQDGRLFVTDTRPNGQPGLQLVSRANVYRHTRHNVWYDEMLTSGNRILVTGYSYAERASEINVFTLGEDGALTRETAYYISSNDYYDTENYATRLVNGNLVIYTPLALSNINPDSQMQWPLVRRWLRDEDHRAITTAGVRLFDARSIYKPVQATRAPFVHSVSICPLGSPNSGDELECRTTAFVGPSQREFFVSTTDIFVWTSPQPWADFVSNPCDNDRSQALPATLYQVPLAEAGLRALRVRGRPDSQLAMDATADEFRALVNWNNCGGGETEVRYFRAPLASFGVTPQPAPSRNFTAAPSPGSSNYEVRFTDAYVVYGGRDSYGSFPPEGRTVETARVIALPVARPTAAIELQAPHSVIRIERTGNNIVLSGYRTDAGLSLSMVDLRARPRIASTVLLENRYESENRSHAFNSLIGADGSGVMGLPTVTRIKESGRWVFRSQASNLSYITADASGRLASAGELIAGGAGAVDPSYRCEVSCVDWYGNTRALFLGQRVLGLAGTELIEGAIRDGRIEEVRRINLSARPPRS